jgi:hypothetical protein
MTITITAVMYNSVASNPENTSAKSAAYPAGPVTWTLPPPERAMERTSSTTGAMSFQPPLPISTGTTTSSARPSLAGIGPTTLPPTWSRPAKRSASAAALAWSPRVTGPGSS